MNAPVVVFAYNRPDHLRKTLDALARNPEAVSTDVTVMVDGPKNKSGATLQAKVIAAAKAFDGSFKTLSVNASGQNKGLAASVIQGADSVLRKHGRVIVVEDDAVTADNFLRFMNDALDFYRDDPTVWSVGGYTVPVDLPENYPHEVIKTRRVSSYAWGTWLDRWEKTDWEVTDYKRFRKSASLRRGFNRWGNDRAGMLDDQMNGRINSWAIRFDYSMFKNDMYNIVPAHSLVQTIGHDGSGTHSGDTDEAEDAFSVTLKSGEKPVVPAHVEPDERIRKEFCKPFELPALYRAKRYIMK